MEPLLELKNINYTYHTMNGEWEALKNISLTVNRGEFISIVGPSGCGKSTLLSIIAGLLTAESGEIIFGNAKSQNTKDKSGTGSSNIGYMLQKDHLFEWRTIYRNVILGLEVQNRLTPRSIENVDKMLSTYGLGAFKASKPSELSGGMRQRAALIRTLALEPDLLLLDEPFSALDYQTRLEVSDDISKIIKSEDKTAILVTHDLSEAIATGDRVVILTKCPAQIKKIVPIKLTIDNSPDGTRTPMASRNAPEFKDYFNMIWKELSDYG